MATPRTKKTNQTKARLGSGEYASEEEQLVDAFNLFLSAAREQVPSMISELESEVLPRYRSYIRARSREKNRLKANATRHRQDARNRFPIGEGGSWRDLSLQRPDVVWKGTALKVRKAILDWCSRFRLLTREQYYPESVTAFQGETNPPHPLAVDFALSTLEFWRWRPRHRDKSFALVGAAGSLLQPVVFDWWPDLETKEEFMNRVRERVESISKELTAGGKNTGSTKDSEHFKWLARFQCTDVLLETLTKDVGRERIWEQLRDTAQRCGIRLRDKPQLRKSKSDFSQ